MLATSDRVRPCRARCSPRAVGRATSSSPAFSSIVMSRLLRSDRSQRGPATRTTSGSTVTVTPSGTGMGLRPIRDIVDLPDLRHDLAADALLTGLVAGQDAARRGDDRRAHAALDLADPAGRRVVALAGARDAAQALDRRAAILGVLERHPDDLSRMVGRRRLDLVAVDVALLLEDSRHLDLELGRGDVDRLVGGLDPVADPREEVGDRIGHRHGYQLLFVIPGM